jgi:integrase
VEKHRLYALYVLALTFGMRQGELLALKWSDISWKAGTITIRRTLRRTGKKTTEDTTKTEAGERVLDLDEDQARVLRAHWTNQEEERVIFERLEAEKPEAERRVWNKDRRVFCNEAGREIAARNLLRQFDTSFPRRSSFTTCATRPARSCSHAVTICSMCRRSSGTPVQRSR